MCAKHMQVHIQLASLHSTFTSSLSLCIVFGSAVVAGVVKGHSYLVPLAGR